MNNKIYDSVELVINDCGVMDYAAGLEMQLELVEKRINDKVANTVIIVEHNPVITLGARKDENMVLASKEFLAEHQIEVVQLHRGGGATAHNPGQIIVYPVIKLRSVGMDISSYIRKLEGVGIELLKWMGISGERKKGSPGIWVGQRKIASIGVKVKRWVTFHGIAINIVNDLGIFSTIVPCGIEAVIMTSVKKETGRNWPMKDVKNKLAEICVRTFSG